MGRNRFLVLAWCLAGFFLQQLWADGQDWDPLIRKLVSDGYSESKVREVFAHPEVRYDPDPMKAKMSALFEAKYKSGLIRRIQRGLIDLGYKPGPTDGLDGPQTRRAITAFQKKYGYPLNGAPSPPVWRQIDETLNPGKYPEERSEKPPVYTSILVPERLQEAAAFQTRHADLLGRVEAQYGIPEEIVVGILTVESRVGNFLGSRKALNTLASMALCSEYSLVEPFFVEEKLTRERVSWLKARSGRTAQWAYSELKALLDYTEENRLDPLTLPGSLYGAIGISQFMPTSAIHYGVDGNQDGSIDLFEVEDALHSLANYLRANGWKGRVSRRASQARILYRYNHSHTYVNTVLAVADHLKEAGRFPQTGNLGSN